MLIYLLSLLFSIGAQGQEPPILLSSETARYFDFIETADLSSYCRGHQLIKSGFQPLLSTTMGLRSREESFAMYFAPVRCADGRIELPLLVRLSDGSLELRRSSFTFEQPDENPLYVTTRRARAGDWHARIVTLNHPGECDPVDNHWWYAFNPKTGKSALHHLGIAYYGSGAMSGLERYSYDDRSRILTLTWRCVSEMQPPSALTSIETFKIVDSAPVYLGRKFSGQMHLSTTTPTFVSPSAASAPGPALAPGPVHVETLKSPRWWRLRQGKARGWQLSEGLTIPDSWQLSETGGILCFDYSATAGKPLP